MLVWNGLGRRVTFVKSNGTATKLNKTVNDTLQVPVSSLVSMADTVRFAVPATAPDGTVKVFVQILALESTKLAYAEPPMALRFTLTLVTVPPPGVTVAVTVKDCPLKPLAGLTVATTDGAPTAANFATNANSPGLKETTPSASSAAVSLPANAVPPV